MPLRNSYAASHNSILKSEEFRGQASQSDDMTCVVLKVEEVDA